MVDFSFLPVKVGHSSGGRPGGCLSIPWKPLENQKQSPAPLRGSQRRKHKLKAQASREACGYRRGSASKVRKY